ncbi:MAG: RNA methyltransferase [Proteobacteria bacterium]|nr:RNA methyltransferase [Pseudomonadota bacterium]
MKGSESPMITSRQNPLVKEIVEAGRRRPSGLFVLEGPHLADEALRADVRIVRVLLGPNADPHIAARLRERAERVFDASAEVVAHAADSQHPQGIVALAEEPPLALEPDRARVGRLLLLDEVRDPGNLGTIMRTAWASGVAGVITVGSCVDPWNPKAVRASAGACFHVPVLRIADRAELPPWLETHGQRALRVEANGRRSCFEADLSSPVTLVLGSEAHGVHPETAAACADSLHVPMRGGCESLNLAATAAVLCYLALDRETRLRS